VIKPVLWPAPGDHPAAGKRPPSAALDEALKDAFPTSDPVSADTAASDAIFRSSSIAFRSSSTALSIASMAVWHFKKDSIALSVFPRSCPAPAANVFTQFRRCSRNWR
jgi:hypothetical protein